MSLPVFQLNQFKLTDQIGEVMNPNAVAISVKISKDLVGSLDAGTVVKLHTTEVGALPVVLEAVSGDSGIGVILFNAKKESYAANDVCEIAMAGSIVTMQASTGFNRFQLVGWNSVSNYVQNTTTNYIGYSLDIASVTGDIVRIFVQPKLS